MATVIETPRHEEHAPPKGLLRWITTTNHKDIGTLYLLFGLAMMFVGGAMALVIRLELFKPGLQWVDPHFFNQMTTLHALVMVFGFIMPVFAGFANWLIPMMVGAPDMALPRLNNWSFWLLPFAATLLVIPLFFEGGAIASGWTLYPPLSLQTGDALPFTIFAVHLLGISSILASINIIVTILNLRAPGLRLWDMPMFCWAWLVTAFLLIVVMPVLAAAVTMLLFDKYFGTSFFNPAGGGDPVLFQHLFWFFGHPEVYIIILPAFGIISAVIPVFSRKPLFGYKSMVFAVAVIAFLSLIVWAHHQFTVGMPVGWDLYFMYATMLIAIPTGVKVFNWLATMWKGAITFETPMLHALGFLVLFVIGGLTGIMMSQAPADMQYHDTYFIVAHFHYTLVGGGMFAAFAGFFFWLPKFTGRMYDERLGKLHFWLSFIGMNLLFFPQHFLGLAGMPRRIPDYAVQFTEFNMMSSVGAFIFGFTQLLLVVILWKVLRGEGKPVDGEVWEGARLHSLEWWLPSPPPYHHHFDEETVREFLKKRAEWMGVES